MAIKDLSRWVSVNNSFPSLPFSTERWVMQWTSSRPAEKHLEEPWQRGTSCWAPHRTVLGKERQKMDCQSFQTFAKSIRMTARIGSRQKHLSKSHLLPNNSSQRQMKTNMEMRQVGPGETDGGVLMNETQHMRDRAMFLMGKKHDKHPQ